MASSEVFNCLCLVRRRNRDSGRGGFSRLHQISSSCPCNLTLPFWQSATFPCGCPRNQILEWAVGFSPVEKQACFPRFVATLPKALLVESHTLPPEGIFPRRERTNSSGQCLIVHVGFYFYQCFKVAELLWANEAIYLAPALETRVASMDI